MPYVFFSSFLTALVDPFAGSDRISQRGCFTSAMCVWSSPFSVNASCLGAALSHVLPWYLEWLYQSTLLKFRCKSCPNWEDRQETSSLSLFLTLWLAAVLHSPPDKFWPCFSYIQSSRRRNRSGLVLPWAPLCFCLPSLPTKCCFCAWITRNATIWCFKWVRDSVQMFVSACFQTMGDHWVVYCFLC